MNTFGLLFESLVVRDLRVYAQLLDGEIRHYRDSAGHEADAVIQLRDGRWALVEVKLGRNKADEAAESLLKLKEKIDTSKVGDPAALVVVTGDGYAHTRPDGVHVVPVGTLAP
jgi:predicted AAA+ superfamily ATPase